VEEDGARRGGGWFIHTLIPLKKVAFAKVVCCAGLVTLGRVIADGDGQPGEGTWQGYIEIIVTRPWGGRREREIEMRRLRDAIKRSLYVRIFTS
jgi:hypothetical protein